MVSTLQLGDAHVDSPLLAELGHRYGVPQGPPLCMAARLNQFLSPPDRRGDQSSACWTERAPSWTAGAADHRGTARDRPCIFWSGLANSSGCHTWISQAGQEPGPQLWRKV